PRGTGGSRTRGSREAEMTIRTPIEWATDQVKLAGLVLGSASRAGAGVEESGQQASMEVRRLTIAGLGDVLAKGLDDFAAYRTDVTFLCVIYRVVGLVMARF